MIAAAARRCAWRWIIRTRFKKLATFDILPTHHVLTHYDMAVGAEFLPLVFHGAAL